MYSSQFRVVGPSQLRPLSMAMTRAVRVPLHVLHIYPRAFFGRVTSMVEGGMAPTQ